MRLIPKGDLISRLELKKAVNDFYDNHFKGLVANELITYAKAVDNAIDNAPTVDTERPHWIKIFENPFTNGYVCSVCGHKIQVTEQFFPKVTECENCGADMRRNTKRKGTPIEGNNESYNCENWIP